MEYSDYIDDAQAGEEVPLLQVIEFDLPLELRGERIDKAIAKVLSNYSRSRIQQWLEAGLIFENGRHLASLLPFWPSRITIKPIFSGLWCRTKFIFRRTHVFRYLNHCTK